MLAQYLVLGAILAIGTQRYIQSSNVDFFADELTSISKIIIPEMKEDIALKHMLSLNENVKRISSNSQKRVTIIDVQGVVLADSDSDASKMPNHLNRDEIKKVVLGADSARSIRHSSTLGKDMLYVAFPVKSGGNLVGVLRLSMPLDNISLWTHQIFKSMALLFVIAALLALAAAYYVSKRMSRGISDLNETALKIAAGDFSAKAYVDSNDEIGALAETFNGMIVRLEQLDTLKKDFVANASHELKTPVTSIIGFAETLENEKLSQENTRYIEIIKKQAQRLYNIVNDLLSLSALENNAAIEKKALNVSDTINNVVSLYRKKASEKKITVDVSIEKNLSDIYANEFNMEQLLVNLIDNAIRYTEEQGKISVKASNAGNFVEIKISDTGIGIPQDLQERIFDRFFVVDKSRSRKSGGTGLGLSIAKHIVNTHQGSISLESKEYEGSTFTIKLPIFKI